MLKKSIFIIALGLLPLCIKAQGCSETIATFREAPRLYPEQTPITVEELKHLLLDDTAHYKVVFFYSHCCGSCHTDLLKTYPYYFQNADTTNVRFYFIADNSGSLKRNVKDMKMLGYNLPVYYYLHDSTAAFSHTFNKETRYPMNNIASYLFPNQPPVYGCQKLPTWFIVSKDGRLKQSLDLTGEVPTMRAMELWQLSNIPIKKLDFSVPDTLRQTSKGMETHSKTYYTVFGRMRE